MKRWWPVAVLLLSLVTAAVGWWLYRELPFECDAPRLYDDWYLGEASLRDVCQGQERTLYTALVLLGVAPLLFVLGWMCALPQVLRQPSKAVRQTIAGVTLVALAGAGWGGYVLWEHRERAQQEERFQAAQAALARLTWPEGISPSNEPDVCRPEPPVRCGRSDLLPRELSSRLMQLVGATRTTGCDRLPSAVACAVSATGSIGGYPATVFATPRLRVAPAGAPLPPGARRLPVVQGSTEQRYALGSDVTIYLMPPEE